MLTWARRVSPRETLISEAGINTSKIQCRSVGHSNATRDALLKVSLLANKGYTNKPNWEFFSKMRNKHILESIRNAVFLAQHVNWRKFFNQSSITHYPKIVSKSLHYRLTWHACWGLGYGRKLTKLLEHSFKIRFFQTQNVLLSNIDCIIIRSLGKRYDRWGLTVLLSCITTRFLMYMRESAESQCRNFLCEAWWFSILSSLCLKKIQITHDYSNMRFMYEIITLTSTLTSLFY